MRLDFSSNRGFVFAAYDPFFHSDWGILSRSRCVQIIFLYYYLLSVCPIFFCFFFFGDVAFSELLLLLLLLFLTFSVLVFKEKSERA